ncbi:MAG TPA: phosphatidylglycerol lysyltransferase domain-containing protein [Anaerolineales bacterium]|jgi:phosphatidylglycerol lysyltransferase
MTIAIRNEKMKKRVHHLPGIVPVLAVMTALMGLVNLVSATFPALYNRLVILEKFLPLEVRRGSHLTAALAGFALLILAENLRRRKRVAWLVATIILIISALSHILKGLDYEEASLSAFLAILLVANRHHFHAHSDMPSVRNGLLVLLVAILFTLAYGATGFFLLDRHFKVIYDLPSALRQSFVMFTQFYDPGLQPLTGYGRFFGTSIYIVAAGTLSYSLFMLARPVLVREPASSQQRSRAREIVEARGHTSLARFSLFPDKSYFFSPAGSLFAFVPRGRVALVLGDPIGMENDFQAALSAFKERCAQNDWLPAFYQVPPDHLEDYKSEGFECLMIGQEAIVDLAAFSLEGKAGKEFRNILNKMDRLGQRATVHQPPQADAVIRDLREVSDEWLTERRGREMCFSVGWFDDEYIRNSQILTISTKDGEISAFANIVSEYKRSEFAVDLMRQRANVENGTMDFLFIAMLRWAKEMGMSTFSLGLSALSGLNEQPDNPSTARVLHYIYTNVQKIYNFQGLHAFKEKFHPLWQPRYLVYPGLASLPQVGAALVSANTGVNFPWVSWPFG